MTTNMRIAGLVATVLRWLPQTAAHLIVDHYVANYSDIPALPLADPGLNPPPSPYLDLIYSGFSVNAAGAPLNTPNPSIYYDQIVVPLALGKPSITADSSVAFFDLHKFTFVCAADTVESAKGVGQSCTLQIWGTKVSTQAVVSTTCGFVHDLLDLTIVPATCELGAAFTGLERVDFETTEAALGVVTAVTALDNLDLTLYKYN